MAQSLQPTVAAEDAAEVALYLPPVRPQDIGQLRRVGEMLYTPGMVPRWGDEVRYTGTVDEEVPVRTAVRAARLCVHNLLALVEHELGSLDRVRGVPQLNILVRCSEGFMSPGRVADGASEAIFSAFGERGRHRRNVVETIDLPDQAPVQVSGIFRVH